jgi:hypothetical protein
MSEHLAKAATIAVNLSEQQRDGMTGARGA